MRRANETKCLVVGDAGVGKTCLLARFVQNRFPTDYIPTVYDNYENYVLAEDGQQHVLLSVWDTRRFFDEESMKYRCGGAHSANRVDVFLACFSVATKSSFASLSHTWIPNVMKHYPEASIVLVGTKMDLRDERDSGKDDDDQEFISKDTVIQTFLQHKKSKKTNYCRYVECSALTGEGVRQVFAAVASVAYQRSMRPGSERNAKCTLQ